MKCHTDDVLDTDNGCDDDVAAGTFDGGCVRRCWLNLCSSNIVDFLWGLEAGVAEHSWKNHVDVVL